jgi:hypothetical protein
MRHQHAKRREETVVERPVLEEGHVEFVGHQRRRDMLSERGMAVDRRQRTYSPALVRHRERLADAQRERRVVIEEERSDVIVEDVDHRVWLLG